MLEIGNAAVVLIDVQGKLAELMQERDKLIGNIQILLKSATSLEIPVLWCEQNPRALGPTVSELAELLEGNEPIEKNQFSCCTDGFMGQLEEIGKRQVLLCGIESHICVYQSAMELRDKGYEVGVVADAVSSRTAENKQLALSRMAAENIAVYSTEMALFELLRTAKHPKFRELSKLVK